MLDPAKSQLLEKVGSIVALWVLALETLCLLLPYLAAHYNVQMSEQDRAILTQIQTTIQNVFIAVVSFFFGASVGGRQKDDSINRMASTADRVQANIAPIVAAVVPDSNPNGVTPGKVTLAAGERVEVKADPPKAATDEPKETE